MSTSFCLPYNYEENFLSEFLLVQTLNGFLSEPFFFWLASGLSSSMGDEDREYRP